MDTNVKILCEDVVSSNESICLGCVINNKVYKLFTKGTQYTNVVFNDVQTEMTHYEDEDFDLIGLDVKLVVAGKSGNMIMSAEEYGNLYDAETFAHIAHIGAIKLLLELSCILKFKLYQMDIKNAFLDRYLNVKVNQDVSNVVIDMDGTIEKNDYVEVIMGDTYDINNMDGVNMEDNENLMIVHVVPRKKSDNREACTLAK